MQETRLFRRYKGELKLILLTALFVLISAGCISYFYHPFPFMTSFAIKGSSICLVWLVFLNLSQSEKTLFYGHVLGFGSIILSAATYVHQSHSSTLSVITLCGLSIIGTYSLLQTTKKHILYFALVCFLASFSLGLGIAAFAFNIILLFTLQSCLTLYKIQRENIKLEKESYQLESMLKYHAQMSHEVLNPLTISMGNLELTIDDLEVLPDTSEIRERLKLCLLNHDRIETIIRDLNRGLKNNDQ